MNSSHQHPQATTYLETIIFYLQKHLNLMKSKNLICHDQSQTHPQKLQLPF